MIQSSTQESLSSACSDDAIKNVSSNCLSELLIQFPELSQFDIPFKVGTRTKAQAKQLLESRACSYPLKMYRGSHVKIKYNDRK